MDFITIGLHHAWPLKFEVLHQVLVSFDDILHFPDPCPNLSIFMPPLTFMHLGVDYRWGSLIDNHKHIQTPPLLLTLSTFVSVFRN